MEPLPPDFPTSATSEAQRLVIGRVVGTHGVRGEIKVLTFNPDSEAIVPGILLFLSGDAEPRTAVVRSVRPHQRFLLVTLDKCQSMNEAEAVVGRDIAVESSALPPLDPDEIYHFELVGMNVVTVDGSALGRIVEVLTTGANDVCSVRGSGREYLIPMIADVIRSIDRDSRTMVIEPLPGLLDL